MATHRRSENLMKRILSLFLLLAATAWAQEYPKPPTFEQVFGATNINAATGNGGMTAAFSARGELTIFRWPNPSFYEHLAYLTANGFDARDLPYFGAQPSMGAFFGLVVQTGKTTEVTWLRDEPWTASQRYLDSRSNVVVTTYEHESLGIEATTFAFVAPDADTLIWRLEVSQKPGSPAQVLRGLFYENLSPSITKIPMVPLDGWALDMFNDFAAVYDTASRAIIHFRVRDRRFSDLTSLMRQPSPTAQDANAFLDSEVSQWPRGMFFGVTVDAPEFNYQVGADDVPVCEALEGLIENMPWDYYGMPQWLSYLPACWLDPFSFFVSILGWKHEPQNALDDAADGLLSGSPVAGIQTNAALSFSLSEQNSATVMLAAADSLTALRAELDRAGAISYADQLDKVQAFWHDWTTGAMVPDTDDEQLVNFAIRALISIKTAQDRQTGNIVASVSTQPPYSFDWPRDAAFLNYALDLAGFRDEVTLHNRSFATWQRVEPIPFGIAPAGTYHMNYDPEGKPGGPIVFEIDNTGLITWSLWDHYLWMMQESNPDAMDYLADVYPAIARAADGLADCKDEPTGLQCYACEDDNIEKVQTMQGTSTVFAALVSAIEAGRAIGEDPDRIQGWSDRADELRDAAFDHFWSDKEGRFTGSFCGECWSIFPSGMLAPGDPMADAQIDRLLTWSQAVLTEDRDLLSYNSKAFVSLAWYYRQTGNEQGLKDVQDIMRQYLHWIPTEGTLHLGEVSILYDLDQDGFRETPVNEVGTPHVWRQALNYTASVLAFGGAPLPAITDDDDDDSDDDNDSADDDDNDSGNPADDSDDEDGCCG